MRIASISSLLLLLAPLGAQAQWTKMSPANTPSKRANGAMTADMVNAYAFGGNLNGTTFYNDLWRYNGTDWTELSKDGATGAPPARRWGPVAYDFARSQILVFGGQDVAKAQLGDTWTWDGSKWTQHSVAVAPSPRRWHGMGYCFNTQRVILFGGFDGTNILDDTWAWDGKAWTKLATKTTPPARARQSMAHKREAKELVMYGGCANGKSPWGIRSDMWMFDGSDWQQIATKNAPYGSGVMTQAMYWDELRERMVIFGGYTSAERKDVWEFDTDTWTQRSFTTQPPNTSGPGMAYMSVFKKAVHFGGYSGPTLKQQGDTWEYQTNAAASASTAGTGCAGVGGVPTIDVDGLPWLDDSFKMDISNIGSGANAMLVLGLSKTTWSGVNLPFNLGVIGYPSCDLLVSMDVMFGGLTSVTVPVPNQSALIGQSVYFQAASLGSTLGVSARTEITVGAR